MQTYTLTETEAHMYDSCDEEITHQLIADLRKRFGRLEPVETDVRHPDGFIVSAHTTRPERETP